MNATTILLPGTRDARLTSAALHLRRRSWVTALLCDRPRCDEFIATAHVSPSDTRALAESLGWERDLCPAHAADMRRQRERNRQSFEMARRPAVHTCASCGDDVGLHVLDPPYNCTRCDGCTGFCCQQCESSSAPPAAATAHPAAGSGASR